MITSQDKLANEILAYLKTKLEIPDGVVGISLHMRVGEAVTVDCQYHPDAKNGGN